MDLMTVSGIFLGGGAIVFVMAHGGILHYLFNVEAIVLIFGGTAGSVMISHPWSVLKLVPSGLKMMFFPPRGTDPLLLVHALSDLAEKARRMGPESLDPEMALVKHPFLLEGVHLLQDGLDLETVRMRLEKDISTTRQRRSQLVDVFRSAGMYSPIFGLLGTLVGVVQVLRNITDPSAMGASMAIAMTASFYGIFSANFVFLPIAKKLTFFMEEEQVDREIIAMGILAIQEGDAPWLVFKKLEAYLSAAQIKERKKVLAVGGLR